jgi:hypothetical protein
MRIYENEGKTEEDITLIIIVCLLIAILCSIAVKV